MLVGFIQVAGIGYIKHKTLITVDVGRRIGIFSSVSVKQYGSSGLVSVVVIG